MTLGSANSVCSVLCSRSAICRLQEKAIFSLFIFLNHVLIVRPFVAVLVFPVFFSSFVVLSFFLSVLARILSQRGVNYLEWPRGMLSQKTFRKGTVLRNLVGTVSHLDKFLVE